MFSFATFWGTFYLLDVMDLQSCTIHVSVYDGQGHGNLHTWVLEFKGATVMNFPGSV
jgi:hypothetical protein